jgi:hypothetical protein
MTHAVVRRDCVSTDAELIRRPQGDIAPRISHFVLNWNCEYSLTATDSVED